MTKATVEPARNAASEQAGGRQAGRGRAGGREARARRRSGRFGARVLGGKEVCTGRPSDKGFDETEARPWPWAGERSWPKFLRGPSRVTLAVGRWRLLTLAVGVRRLVALVLGGPRLVTLAVGGPRLTITPLVGRRPVTAVLGGPRFMTTASGGLRLETAVLGEPPLVTMALVGSTPAGVAPGRPLPKGAVLGEQNPRILGRRWETTRGRARLPATGSQPAGGSVLGWLPLVSVIRDEQPQVGSVRGHPVVRRSWAW